MRTISNGEASRQRTLWPGLIASLAAVILIVAGCGGDDDGSASSGAAAEDNVKLSFSHSNTTAHPHHKAAELIADRVKDQGIEIELFPNSQLGADDERFAALQAGDIDIDLQGSSALSATFGPIGILDTAYLFDGPDDLFAFFDSDESQQLRQEFEEATGTKILGVWFFGMRHFTANKPIRKPEDLKGLRMRFPDSPRFLANARALGADATAVAFEEVFLSLQQGVIDGQENPVPTIEEMKFVEVQDYVSLSGHQTGSQLALINREKWEALSQDQQEALQSAFDAAREEDRKWIEELDQKLLDEWRDSGEIEIVDDVDTDAFRQRAVEYFSENLEGEELELFKTIRGLD